MVLDRKLRRDLWHMKGQAIAIAMVIVSGVSTYVLLISNMTSLTATRDAFYQEFAFADIFASLKRAPEELAHRIAKIPGVERIETRVISWVKLDITGFPEPVTAKIVSLPDMRPPALNRLFIRKGRMPGPWKENEVVVSEAFAEAHRFSPGDSFGAIINGRWKRLTVVGIALSPEFVIQARPGAISPDYKRFAILWMGRHALGTASDMGGAFNDLAISLSKGAMADDVIVRLDSLLERYGGTGGYGRKDQLSNRYLTEEFRQLERSAEIFPAIFISVAAFLLNVVINRTVGTQREQIAALKSFGYSNLDIGLHYTKMMLIIVFAGSAGGIAVGIWLGRSLGRLYMEFYRFPYLMYELRPSVAAAAVFVTTAAALGGTVMAVRRAALLPPAEAMRPEPPTRYRKTFVEELTPWRLLAQPTRIIFRNIERRPFKAFLTVTGISLSCAIMIAGRFSKDAVDFMVDVQFKRSQKEDMSVTFTEPTSRRAVFELRGIEGVEHSEGFRSVPVIFRYGHISYRSAVKGYEKGGTLQNLLDMELMPVELPSEGIVLTDYLADMLGVKPGDMLTIEVLEGSRQIRQVPVVGLIRQYIGIMGYMDMAALNRMMREGNTVSGAYLALDQEHRNAVYRKLIGMPRVAGAVVRKDEIQNFYETQAEALLFFTFVATVLACTISFGVVYNTARIALSERGRELASLRVLGYTRAEISYIFLGELGLLTLTAVPFGFIIGRGICVYIAHALQSELFRVPVVIENVTYAMSASVVVVSAIISGLIVRHRLDHLDLVAVLKTRE